MTLFINSGRTQISILDTLLDLFIATPASYTDIDIQIYFNSTTSSTTKTYSVSVPITTTTPVASVAGLEYVNPSFFDTTIFAEGVYNIIITLTAVGSIQTSEGCLYVENGLKCQVDTYLMDETITVNERVLEGLKYQSLVSSADCPCKCKEKVELYLNLIDTLTNKCKTC